jgi:aromatic ring hydroxylase
MRTKGQYIDGLRKMRRNLYVNGDLIDRDDELQMDCINTLGTTFDYANDSEHQELCTATSHLTGKKINRFCHVHQNKDDLHEKQDMTRMFCCAVGGCIQRCMGNDAANAIYTVSYEADKDNKGATNYHENFKKWLERFQDEDLVGCCAQTDVKGHRTKRPSEQEDPDLYLHVVDRKKDGVVVRGCKVHISEASVADEILVVPTRALKPEEKDWAIAFAIPADWENLKHVVTIRRMRPREHFPRGFSQGATDSYLIFDNVFVPNERIFLNGETVHGGTCALLFALFHRHSYSGCKPAIGDLMMGTAALIAEYNGIEKASHVRAKLAEFIKITELGYAAGFTASELGGPQVYVPGRGFRPYGPGNYIPHSIYANVGRFLSGEAVFHENEMICDLAGGVPATFPYEGDFVNPETKDLLNKYIMRNPNISAENAAQLWRYVGDLLCSAAGGVRSFGAYHGGGSPVMEQIAVTTQYDIESRKQMVKRLAGIKD